MDMIQDRLKAVESKLKDQSFLHNKGLGNEIGYYIFDYPPKEEIEVRKWIENMQKKNTPSLHNYELKVYDIYDIMIDIIKKEGYLQQCFDIEKKHGTERMVAAIGRLLRLSENSGGRIVDYIRENTPSKAVIFIVGVGKSYPVLRSHKVLNNLHQVFDAVPVILFYPDNYDEQELVLLGRIKDGNYYRAFRLSP